MHTLVLNLVRLLLVVALIGAYLNKRWLVFFVSCVALAATFLPVFLDRRFGIKIPADFEVTVILFIYGSLFFGEVRGFYSAFWWWDIALNFAAAIALGLVGFTILYVLYKEEMIDASPLIIGIFTFCFAVAIGTMWEIFEFSSDYFFGFNLQRSGIDTMIDLVVNAAGAFIVSIVGYVYIKGGNINIVSKLISSFIERNPKFFRSEKENVWEKLLELIKGGESESLEFKSTLRINMFTKQFDKTMERAVLKTVVAYLNSSGGTLLVGVSDKGEILGIEKEGFGSNDKLSLHFTNLIKESIGNEFLPFIQFGLVGVDGKHILRVKCKKSDRPVFLKIANDEEFYVRNGPATVRLNGRELVEYVRHKFEKKEN